MSDLLSGLSKLGLSNLEGMEVFSPEEKADLEKGHVAPVKKKEPEEADFLFDRKYTCPVCGGEIVSKTVRSNSVRIAGTDYDLRPRYQQLDPLKYDVVACRYCGYAALARNFSIISDGQISQVQAKISASFKSQPEFTGKIYTYDNALEQYKLALANAIVKTDKTSEKAYLCLKTAWIYRGKREVWEAEIRDLKSSGKPLHKEDVEHMSLIPELVKEERKFLKSALEGFLGARSTESFPMCGMDELTVDYLIAALATQFEQYDTAYKLLGNILVSRVANNRLKDKARELKNYIAERKNKRVATQEEA